MASDASAVAVASVAAVASAATRIRQPKKKGATTKVSMCHFA